MKPQEINIPPTLFPNSISYSEPCSTAQAIEPHVKFESAYVDEVKLADDLIKIAENAGLAFLFRIPGCVLSTQSLETNALVFAIGPSGSKNLFIVMNSQSGRIEIIEDTDAPQNAQEFVAAYSNVLGYLNQLETVSYLH